MRPAQPRATGFGLVIYYPNTHVASAGTISGFRPPPMRGPSFRPPRQIVQQPTQAPVQVNPTSTSSVQPRSSPTIVTHDFHGGPMTFIPTPSMQHKPNGSNGSNNEK